MALYNFGPWRGLHRWSWMINFDMALDLYPCEEHSVWNFWSSCSICNVLVIHVDFRLHKPLRLRAQKTLESVLWDTKIHIVGSMRFVIRNQIISDVCLLVAKQLSHPKCIMSWKINVCLLTPFANLASERKLMN